MLLNTDRIIIKNLIFNETFARKTIPFLKTEYFQDTSDKFLFKEISDFIINYNNLPSKEALIIITKNASGITEEIEKNCIEILLSFKQEQIDEQWLLDITEKFCQEKALYNAVSESLQIMDGEQKKPKTAIPTILSDALAVSFDTHVGHDYLDENDSRYEYYHKRESKFKFGLDILNEITNGGIPPKTLNIIMGGVGFGKTLFLCDFAANYLSQGYNVLYITLEMAEEEIAKRIDANLLNIKIEDLMEIPRDIYDKKFEKLKRGISSKLVIKEFPTASAGVLHFRNLLNELNLKRGFKPQIIMVDYINLCISSRVKMGSTVGSYTFIKSIAEELRGLGVEFGAPIWTATQLNRTGFSSSDVDMGDVAESFGTMATADFVAAIVSNEEMESLDQILFKQLKNRYNDVAKSRRIFLGIDKSKMRVYQPDSSAQDNMMPEHIKKEVDKMDKFKDLK